MTKLLWAACVAGLFVCVPSAVHADATYHSLASGDFSQDWSDAGLITVNDVWSGVPSVVGYRGDGLAATGADPQTVLGEGTPVVDVNANQSNPNSFNTGGVTEFAITNPTVALSGSGTARAPHIVIYLDTTNRMNVVVSYALRDIDGSTGNAVQPVAVQYRVGSSGMFTNIPLGFVADATTGPSLADLVTSVSVTLPADAWNQAQVQVRILTTDASSADERVGIDDILVTSTGAPVATLDFGDAPASYDDPVAASHVATAGGPRLGTLIDAESGPQSSVDASGDGADEDGVTMPPVFTRGSTVSIPVFGESPGAGYELIAYFDWDRDGEHDDFEVLDDTITGSFTGSIVVAVPLTAALGTTFVRFRIATTLSLDPDGAEADGEVEDYAIAVVAACGDGIVDTGETCDDAGGTGTCGCLADCSGFASVTTSCGAAGDACDPADFCDGAGACVARIAPSGTSCRATAGDCDVAEVCTGSSPVCPPDVVRPSVALCRPVAGDGCDVAEFCTGVDVACPGDSVRTSAFECRASTGTCDAAESCDGSTVLCPANGFAPNGTACNDGNACTSADTCTSGSCGGPALSCGDGDVCTNDFCNPTTGCANPAIAGCCTNAADCADGTACTNDVCNLATNTCANTTVACVAPDACSTSTCDPSTGCTTVPVVCNDGNACTTDACSPSTGCAFAPVSCNDSNACTVDSCSPSTGCANVALSCDDSDVCTADVCSPTTGCGSMPIPGCCTSDTDCGDGNACTTDSCNTSTNTCTNVALSCDDGNVCTGDVCSPTTGCGNMPIAGCCDSDSDCADTSACTTDACSPITNTCTNVTLSCDDGNVCTTDACSPTTGCSNIGVVACCTLDAHCGDGDACTSDACNVATNTCSNPAIDCDDGDVCTADMCSAGACVHDAEPACFDAGTLDAGTPDAGIIEDDAGVDEDAAIEDDAGTIEADAGIEADTGIENDAGIEDAGIVDEDAGDDAGMLEIDASLPDAALPDSGPGDGGAGDVGPSDVGPFDASPDAGAPVVEMGCGCRVQSATHASWWPLVSLAMLALIITRRRR
jgi:MYXO-CTERM domain-containing protein